MQWRQNSFTGMYWWIIWILVKLCLHWEVTWVVTSTRITSVIFRFCPSTSVIYRFGHLHYLRNLHIPYKNCSYGDWLAEALGETWLVVMSTWFSVGLELWVASRAGEEVMSLPVLWEDGCNVVVSCDWEGACVGVGDILSTTLDVTVSWGVVITWLDCVVAAGAVVLLTLVVTSEAIKEITDVYQWRNFSH